MGCKAVCYFLCWCFFSVLLSFLFIAHLLMLSHLWHCCTTKSSWSCRILMLISSIGHNPHSKWKMCSFIFELLKVFHGSADAEMSQPCDHNYPGFSPVLWLLLKMGAVLTSLWWLPKRLLHGLCQHVIWLLLFSCCQIESLKAHMLPFGMGVRQSQVSEKSVVIS